MSLSDQDGINMQLPHVNELEGAGDEVKEELQKICGAFWGNKGNWIKEQELLLS